MKQQWINANEIAYLRVIINGKVDKIAQDMTCRIVKAPLRNWAATFQSEVNMAAKRLLAVLTRRHLQEIRGYLVRKNSKELYLRQN